MKLPVTIPTPAPVRVALFTRAWIEIFACASTLFTVIGRPLHEGVD